MILFKDLFLFLEISIKIVKNYIVITKTDIQFAGI